MHLSGYGPEGRGAESADVVGLGAITCRTVGEENAVSRLDQKAISRIKRSRKMAFPSPWRWNRDANLRAPYLLAARVKAIERAGTAAKVDVGSQ